MRSKGISDRTAVERVAGSLLAESAGTLIAAFSGMPVAALLPVLTNSLANGRQRKRVEGALEEMNAILQTQQEDLQRLSDEQYKLINEAILAVFYTTDERKLAYLREVVRNGMTISSLVPQESAVLARVVRDISAEELDFLIRNFGFNRIQISSSPPSDQEDLLVVTPESEGGLVAIGLIALGLLVPGEPTWGDSGRYKFSGIVAKLLALVGAGTDGSSRADQHMQD